jgi:hypothetical protein
MRTTGRVLWWFLVGIAGGGGGFLLAGVIQLVLKATSASLANWNPTSLLILTLLISWALFVIVIKVFGRRERAIDQRIVLAVGYVTATSLITLLIAVS